MKALTVPQDPNVATFLREPSESTFGPLFDQLYPRIFRYFAVRGLTTDVAGELSSDVLWAVFRNVHSLRCHETFYGWLFQIARNSLLQYRRKHHRELIQPFSPETLAVFTPPPLESLFYDWIQCLDEDEREICVLRYVDDLDYQAIADALELPMGTVKWKLHQIKAKIATLLAQPVAVRR